jgi:hypothetical protein
VSDLSYIAQFALEKEIYGLLRKRKENKLTNEEEDI